MAKYRKYSKEFRLQTAKLVAEQGYSYQKAAKRLGTTGWGPKILDILSAEWYNSRAIWMLIS